MASAILLPIVATTARAAAGPTVDRVVDVDTVVAGLEGQSVRVRLIGV